MWPQLCIDASIPQVSTRRHIEVCLDPFCFVSFGLSPRLDRRASCRAYGGLPREGTLRELSLCGTHSSSVICSSSIFFDQRRSSRQFLIHSCLNRSPRQSKHECPVNDDHDSGGDGDDCGDDGSNDDGTSSCGRLSCTNTECRAFIV